MSKYYYLVAGLPNLALEESKLPYTVASFHAELEEQLTERDKQLVRLFYLKYDNRNLLAFLQDAGKAFDARGAYTPEAFDTLRRSLKEEEKLPQGLTFPPYLTAFLGDYLAATAEGVETHPVAWEDRLAARYYAYAMRCKNRFVADWFALNLNINNILTAYTCRKHGLDKSLYIVGDNAVAEALRSSNARDFGLGDAVDYLPELQRLAEEPDLLAREKRMDLLKWRWLDEQTFFKPFDIESLFAYLLKLEMLERWATLDRAEGEKRFRSIVGAMKRGSENALEEFKRNNTR